RQRETTRVGAKKAAPTSVSTDQAGSLKHQQDLLIRLLMCLLVDHGLRVGEVAALTPACFDLDAAQLRFYRSKVDKTQVHDLSDDALAAAEALLSPPERPGEPPPPKRPDDQPLFPSDREIRRIVAAAGEAIGLARLSPHDLRHAWATAATRAGTATRDLQEAGGWSSPAMPLRYAEAQEVANRGVKLKR
ncbi:MAG TPA: site-specific integrase, partial [Roseiflexaceae bacterium]|nr:site-specific integrase [Roseiflexaceae bacterium]